MNILLEPLRFEFFVYGTAAATLAGALCALIGVYVVLRGKSYIGHGLSHAMFGGAVLGYVTGANFYLAAGLWGFIAALMIDRVSRRRAIGADAAIGVVTTAAFALGLVLVSRYSGFTRNFEAALFGNVLGVEPVDVWVVGGVLAAAVALVFCAFRPLLFATFDPEVARASGIEVARIDVLFTLVLAATVVATMQILGVTLVAAALVIPAAVARLLTDSFTRMVLFSVAIGAFSGLGGMYLSYYLDVASGAAVVLVAAALFVIVYAAGGALKKAALT